MLFFFISMGSILQVPVTGSTLQEPNCEKNENDVAALNYIIKAQRKRGATVSENLNNKREYTWKHGRLIKINWRESRIKGALNLNKLKGLEKVCLDENKITKLYVGKCVNLQKLDCGINRLKKINVKNNKKLKRLSCRQNMIRRINIRNNKKLRVLLCYRNKLKEINVKNNKKLVLLSCYKNQIKKLDLKNNKRLEWLNCGNNKLTTLDMRHYKRMDSLICYYNQLTDIKLQENVELNTFYCNNNRLKNFNFKISVLDELYIDISHNAIKKVDMSQFVEYPYEFICDPEVCLYGWNTNKYKVKKYIQKSYKEKGIRKVMVYNIEQKRINSGK